MEVFSGKVLDCLQLTPKWFSRCMCVYLYLHIHTHTHIYVFTNIGKINMAKYQQMMNLDGEYTADPCPSQLSARLNFFK